MQLNGETAGDSRLAAPEVTVDSYEHLAFVWWRPVPAHDLRSLGDPEDAAQAWTVRAPASAQWDSRAGPRDQAQWAGSAPREAKGAPSPARGAGQGLTAILKSGKPCRATPRREPAPTSVLALTRREIPRFNPV